MNERLRSRLEMGIVADLRVPDVETRIAILEEGPGQGIPSTRHPRVRGRQDRVEYPRVEGALLKICAYASLNTSR